MRNLKLLEEEVPKHPAKYSKQLLENLKFALSGSKFILDPMAGTGEALLSIRPDAWLNEIEPRWAAISKKLTFRSFVGDATDLAWSNGFFDAIVVSPTYGNRMADHHEAKDTSKRNTYRHTLGEPLQPGNSGMLQWGDEYRAFHREAWTEAIRVLKPGGKFVLNVKDHIRKGEVIRVAYWHAELLHYLGLWLQKYYTVVTPGNRQGANHEARVDEEYIFIFEK